MLKVCLKVEASKTLENYYETLPDIIKTYLGKLSKTSPNFKSEICQSPDFAVLMTLTTLSHLTLNMYMVG